MKLRPTIPKVVGTLPDKIEDPVLIEIFGMHKHYFDGLEGRRPHHRAQGLPGVARGRERARPG